MKLKRASIITKAVILALIVYACISIVTLRSRIADAKTMKENLQQQVNDMSQENEKLEYELENAGDPDTIEDIARDKLGLVEPGERIYYDIGS